MRTTVVLRQVRPGDVIHSSSGEPWVLVRSINPVPVGPYVKVDGEPLSAQGEVWASRRQLGTAFVTVEREEII